MIYLTSFFKSGELPEDVQRWSAAVYQPRGYNFPKAAWTDIRDEDGQWIRPRNFLNREDPAAVYFDTMLEHYWNRFEEAGDWIDSLGGADAALCCWCPYDRAAKRQLEEFGSFICHTGPLGKFLYQLGADVEYDDDRKKMYGCPRHHGG